MNPSTRITLARCLAVLVVLSAYAACGFAADRKPNFLFVYTDDHRWDAIGVVQQEQDMPPPTSS